MSEMTVEQFCDMHYACTEGRNWALSTGLTTMRDLWQREDMRPEWRSWIATRPGVLTYRELRLYACWCVRQVWHLLTDERSRTAVEVAERHVEGRATDAELEAALAAARAARAAGAAGAAAEAAALAAVESALAAERAAALAALAVRAAAAARADQSRYLLDNTRPDFTTELGGPGRSSLPSGGSGRRGKRRRPWAGRNAAQ